MLEIFTGPHVYIPLVKAEEMYGWAKARMLRFCKTCNRLVLGESSTGEGHNCALYKHSVGDSWLCIPCFLEGETRALGFPIYRTTRCLY